MERLKLALLACLLIGATSCTPTKGPNPAPTPVPAPASPTVLANHAEVFPVPYFPTREVTLFGKPVAQWNPDWSSVGLYTTQALSDAEKKRLADLEPAGGEGEVGLSFTRDFDGDGRDETVVYGAYAKTSGEEGNFVLVYRPTDPAQPLLLQELPGPPTFTVFTLKPDLSLWFGGGIDAGEVTMLLRWQSGQPTFQRLEAE